MLDDLYNHSIHSIEFWTPAEVLDLGHMVSDVTKGDMLSPWCKYNQTEDGMLQRRARLYGIMLTPEIGIPDIVWTRSICLLNMDMDVRDLSCPFSHPTPVRVPSVAGEL